MKRLANEDKDKGSAARTAGLDKVFIGLQYSWREAYRLSQGRTVSSALDDINTNLENLLTQLSKVKAGKSIESDTLATVSTSSALLKDHNFVKSEIDRLGKDIDDMILLANIRFSDSVKEIKFVDAAFYTWYLEALKSQVATLSKVPSAKAYQVGFQRNLDGFDKWLDKIADSVNDNPLLITSKATGPLEKVDPYKPLPFDQQKANADLNAMRA